MLLSPLPMISWPHVLVGASQPTILLAAAAGASPVVVIGVNCCWSDARRRMDHAVVGACRACTARHTSHSKTMVVMVTVTLTLTMPSTATSTTPGSKADQHVTVTSCCTHTPLSTSAPRMVMMTIRMTMTFATQELRPARLMSMHVAEEELYLP